MTREEQILNKAIDYSEIEENFLEYYDCGDVCDDKDFIEKAFIEGANWADANPNKKLVYTKKELLDMGFRFDQNGNISIPQEIEERKKQRIHHRKDKWIERACGWIDSNFPTIDNVGSWYKEGFIKRFKKAMES